VLKGLFRLLVLVALVGGVAAYFYSRGGGHLKGDLGLLGGRVGDAKTAAAVQAALSVHRDLARCDIEASTEGGVVTLRGEVPSVALRRRAETLVGAVPDVRQVVNHLRVSGLTTPTPSEERTLGESLDDRTVALRVKLAFSLDRSLAGAPIDVAVFRRVVTLSGQVGAAAQAEAALRIAQETAGVASVVDLLSVRGEVPSRVERVRRALAANPSLAGADILVRERQGRIVLAGRLRTRAERDLAGLLAEKAAAGPVDNRLEVGP
jgi:hyperosmotically inducible protein